MEQLPKPDIPADLSQKWQEVVDLIARLADVPSCLLMKTHAPDHSVLISNSQACNPYEVGKVFNLGDKLYCRNVIEDNDELVVEDAGTDPFWNDNEDMEDLGMSFYVGLPVLWPDDTIFGTICILDRKVNERALLFREGLKKFRDVIETDLTLLVEMERADGSRGGASENHSIIWKYGLRNAQVIWRKLMRRCVCC